MKKMICDDNGLNDRKNNCKFVMITFFEFLSAFFRYPQNGYKMI